MRLHTHVMLVSGQPTPNLTPVLDKAVRPERAVLVVSPDMKQRAQWLEEIYRPRGVKAEYWDIDNAWDIEHIQTRMLELLEREQAQEREREIALNATGGTKPMSIAAYEAFRAYELPVYYVHPEQDRLIWLAPAERSPHELAGVISIPDFIRAHGAVALEHEDIRIPPEYRDFARDLIESIDRYADAVRVLNGYAGSAEGGLRSDPLEPKHLKFAAFTELLDRLERLGLITAGRESLQFTDEAARFFVSGGWLEQHVFAVANGLRKGEPAIQDVARGLQIEWRLGGSRNEIDVALLARNRLHLIECKTRVFRNKNENACAQALYKLDSLSEAMGGLQARALLVSYHRLSQAEAQRAKDLGIAVIQGRELTDLEARLRRWLLPPWGGGREARYRRRGS